MQSKSYGCKLSKVDLRDHRIKASVSNLPEEFELKFTHYIKNQKQVSSCVAHAASEILQYYSKEVMSTNFIYGTRKELYGDTGKGMYISDACKTLKNYGDLIETDYPGNIEAPDCFKTAKTILADTDKLNKAYYYRIDSYYKCGSINDIKAALINHGPVLAAVAWYNTYNLTNNVIEFDTSSNCGHHAIMIYGWTKDGWLIQNSWGSSFGKKGCAILPFKYKIEEARGLIDHDNSKDTSDIIVPNRQNRKCIDIIYKNLNLIINLILKR